MAERRPLIAGIKPAGDVSPALEKQFVYGEKGEGEKPARLPATEEGTKPPAKGRDPVGRVPLTTRVRGDYAAALKRASLERQLNGQFPNTLQDILEEALGPWLRDHGYVK